MNNEKIFLNKSIKEIFSEDISPRLNNYPPTHNKIIIESLINEEDEDKKIILIHYLVYHFWIVSNIFVEIMKLKN